jgi:hypothetical protein
MKSVKQSIRAKYENIKEDNLAEAKEYFNNFLEQNYSVI